MGGRFRFVVRQRPDFLPTNATPAAIAAIRQTWGAAAVPLSPPSPPPPPPPVVYFGTHGVGLDVMAVLTRAAVPAYGSAFDEYDGEGSCLSRLPSPGAWEGLCGTLGMVGTLRHAGRVTALAGWGAMPECFLLVHLHEWPRAAADRGGPVRIAFDERLLMAPERDGRVVPIHPDGAARAAIRKNASATAAVAT